MLDVLGTVRQIPSLQVGEELCVLGTEYPLKHRISCSGSEPSRMVYDMFRPEWAFCYVSVDVTLCAALHAVLSNWDLSVCEITHVELLDFTLHISTRRR